MSLFETIYLVQLTINEGTKTIRRPVMIFPPGGDRLEEHEPEGLSGSRPSLASNMRSPSSHPPGMIVTGRPARSIHFVPLIAVTCT